jgi:hypothetical protein
MKINELTDEMIEECIDGSTDLGMVKSIFKQRFVLDNKGLIVETNFADYFAQAVQHFISEDDPVEWQMAYDTNYEWGISIASNINELLLETK